MANENLDDFNDSLKEEIDLLEREALALDRIAAKRTKTIDRSVDADVERRLGTPRR